MPRLTSQVRMRKESENTEPIVHRDEHDALLSQGLTIKYKSATTTVGKAATMEINHDRKVRVL